MTRLVLVIGTHPYPGIEPPRDDTAVTPADVPPKPLPSAPPPPPGEVLPPAPCDPPPAAPPAETQIVEVET